MAGCLDDVFFKTDNINAWKTILRPFSLLWQGLKVNNQTHCWNIDFSLPLKTKH